MQKIEYFIKELQQSKYENIIPCGIQGKYQVARDRTTNVGRNHMESR